MRQVSLLLSVFPVAQLWWGGDKKADAPVAFKLTGAGATFPAPLYNSWFQSFAKETGNKVNYQAVGSGSGVRQFTAKTVDFGASDGAVVMLSRNCL